jgi:predicted nucleic-acid-binding protein
VLLRFVLSDDLQQTPVADRWMQALTPREPGYVSLLVLCEFAWVLAVTYRKPRAEIESHLTGILDAGSLRVEQAGLVNDALEAYRTSKADFADCCIAALGQQAGCQHTVTFDRAASKLPGMRLLS